MTLFEFERAKGLLKADQLSELSKIQVGKWVATNADGIQGVFERKSDALTDLTTRHCQPRTACKSYRHGQGVYAIAIPDLDENPTEKFYHTYTLEKITMRSLFRFQVLTLSSLLPDWYFNPYSQEYRDWHSST